MAHDYALSALKAVIKTRDVNGGPKKPIRFLYYSGVAAERDQTKTPMLMAQYALVRVCLPFPNVHPFTNSALTQRAGRSRECPLEARRGIEQRRRVVRCQTGSYHESGLYGQGSSLSCQLRGRPPYCQGRGLCGGLAAAVHRWIREGAAVERRSSPNWLCVSEKSDPVICTP